MALVAGTLIAATVTGGLLAVSIREGRQAAADVPTPESLEAPASPSPVATASERVILFPSPSAIQTARPSPTASVHAQPAATPGTAAQAPTPVPTPDEPEPEPDSGVGGATPLPRLAVDWTTIPMSPAASNGSIADVIELSSGELGLVFWAADRSAPDPVDLVLAYDRQTGSWREIALAGDPLPIGTNTDMVVVGEEIVVPSASNGGYGLDIYGVEPEGDEWVATLRGAVDDTFLSASDSSATALDGLLYVAEHEYRPSASTRFLVYDPQAGVVERTAATPGFLIEAFSDDRYVYAGSWDDGRLARYDPELDAWEDYAPAPPFGAPRYRYATVTGDGMVWVPAYHEGGTLIWAWDPAAEQWLSVEMPDGLAGDVHLLTATDGSLIGISPNISFVVATPPEG